MWTRSVGRRALGVGLTGVLLVSCGGGTAELPRQSTLSRGYEAPAAYRNASGSEQNLLYIGNVTSVSTLYIYTYPQGQHKNTITGYPLKSINGVCADSAGRVYVPNNTSGSTSAILVYAHGGTSPTRSLSVKGSVGWCSVDPVSGNLAVFSISASQPYGGLLIYPKAKGQPKHYPFPDLFSAVGCTYDNKGNIFINRLDTKVSKSYAILSELPRGGSNFVTITLPYISEIRNAPGAIRWDGKDLALGDGTGSIYRLAVTGRKARIVGVTRLDGSFDVSSFWIEGSTLVGGNNQNSSVMIWNYPKGGQPSKVIKNAGDHDSVAVSVAPSQ